MMTKKGLIRLNLQPEDVLSGRQVPPTRLTRNTPLLSEMYPTRVWRSDFFILSMGMRQAGTMLTSACLCKPSRLFGRETALNFLSEQIYSGSEQDLAITIAMVKLEI